MKRRRNLIFKRAYFPKGFNSNLELVLRNTWQKFSEPSDRQVPVDLFRHLMWACIEEAGNDNGVVARFFEFEDGTTGLVDIARKDMTAELEELMPPTQRKFLANEFVVLVKENNIVACHLGNKHNSFSAHLQSLAEKFGVLEKGVALKIGDVPNRTTLQKIQSTGVKKIDLSVESYLASLDEVITTKFDRVKLALFGRPHNKEELHKRAAMTARLTLSRGSFRKDEEHFDRWLSFVGTEIVSAEYSDSYRIELEDTTIISNDQLRIMKSVELNRHANSVSYSHTKIELEKYYEELMASGVLTW